MGNNLQETITQVMAYNVAGYTVSSLLSSLLLLIICLVVAKILLNAFTRALERTGVEKGLHSFLRGMAKAVLLFLTVLIVAASLEIPVTSLIAVLSVAGLAISLAVQNTLSNVAGGIQLLSSKPFTAGDYIDAGGVSGTVAEVGIVYTKILTVDNKAIQVPNSQIAGEKITNYTAEERRRVDLTFTTSYDDPPERVKQAIQKVVGTHPLIFATPEPFVRVSGYGDSAIEYTVRVWCATGDYWTVHFDLLEQVKAAVAQAGVEMTYPHINVHMVKEDP